MKFQDTPRTEANPIQIAPLVRWLLLAVMIGATGLMYVYIKNQQHALGQKTRGVEREIREEQALNEVLYARISNLTSRSELLRKLQAGRIALQPIADHCIARLIPPTTAEADGVLRTAANERFRP